MPKKTVKGNGKGKKSPARTKIFAAGGQAVIEGVLMRSKRNMAIAVRTPKGRISVKRERLHSVTERYKILSLPFARGIVNMAEMLAIGFRALNYSANEAMGTEEEKVSSGEMALTAVIAAGIALVLFKFLPLLAANALYPLFKDINGSYILFNILDGVIKIMLFLAYIAAIGLMKDVKRLFEYHGAEHMAVHCYEHKKELTVQNVKKFRPEHPRCGTSFIIIVLIMSIFIYTFIPLSFSFWEKLGLRILLLPVIAGISYELLKLSAKFGDNAAMRMVTLPGILVQKMTTRRPDSKQTEVAIASLKAVLEMEK